MVVGTRAQAVCVPYSCRRSCRVWLSKLGTVTSDGPASCNIGAPRANHVARRALCARLSLCRGIQCLQCWRADHPLRTMVARRPGPRSFAVRLHWKGEPPAPSRTLLCQAWQVPQAATALATGCLGHGDRDEGGWASPVPCLWCSACDGCRCLWPPGGSVSTAR